MKKVGLLLTCLFLLSVLSVSLISASILGSWFEKSNQNEKAVSEDADSNPITGWFSWSWSRSRSRQRAYCGDGKINVAGEQCDRTNLGEKHVQRKDSAEEL